ncbi:hypothetical protein XELAEV_18043471mg, partial [Xenopus laevis]
SELYDSERLPVISTWVCAQTARKSTVSENVLHTHRFLCILPIISLTDQTCLFLGSHICEQLRDNVALTVLVSYSLEISVGVPPPIRALEQQAVLFRAIAKRRLLKSDSFSLFIAH